MYCDAAGWWGGNAVVSISVPAHRKHEFDSRPPHQVLEDQILPRIASLRKQTLQALLTLTVMRIRRDHIIDTRPFRDRDLVRLAVRMQQRHDLISGSEIRVDAGQVLH